MKKSEITTKELGHVGLVAGAIKKVYLVKRLDEKLPVSKEKGAFVTMGERVAGMILNTLGFLDTRLYLFTEFLSKNL